MEQKFKNLLGALAGLQVLFLVTAFAEVVGSIPSCGMYRRQLIDVSHIDVSLSLSPYLSL